MSSPNEEITVRIVKFSRIDTITRPGLYLSSIRVSGDEGPGEDVSNVADILDSDRDSIDGILIRTDDGSGPESIPGIHRLIKEIRPTRVPILVITPGNNASALDDLMGANYVNHVILRLDDVPTAEQSATISSVLDNGATFSVWLSPKVIDNDVVCSIAEKTVGHEEFVILVPNSVKKKDLNAMTACLKGKARNVRVQVDLRRA